MRAAGIDVGKANLDMAVDGEPGVTRFANNRAGVTKLVKRLTAMGAERVVVEATGGYEEPLLEACCDAGLWIARVNPRQGPRLRSRDGGIGEDRRHRCQASCAHGAHVRRPPTASCRTANVAA